jgi:hypothetical protein
VTPLPRQGQFVSVAYRIAGIGLGQHGTVIGGRLPEPLPLPLPDPPLPLPEPVDPLVIDPLPEGVEAEPLPDPVEPLPVDPLPAEPLPEPDPQVLFTRRLTATQLSLVVSVATSDPVAAVPTIVLKPQFMPTASLARPIETNPVAVSSAGITIGLAEVVLAPKMLNKMLAAVDGVTEGAVRLAPDPLPPCMLSMAALAMAQAVWVVSPVPPENVTVLPSVPSAIRQKTESTPAVLQACDPSKFHPVGVAGGDPPLPSLKAITNRSPGKMLAGRLVGLPATAAVVA